MAGSYNHLVGVNGEFTFEYIENLGDAHEACEDCFQLIKQLKTTITKQHAALNDIVKLSVPFVGKEEK